MRRVLEPVLAGMLTRYEPYDDDTRYVTDLGLVAPARPLRIANPIYHDAGSRGIAMPWDPAS